MTPAHNKTGVGHTPPGTNGVGGKDEYGTPDELWTPLNSRWRFDFDAAASHENHKAARYATAEGVFEECSHLQQQRHRGAPAALCRAPDCVGYIRLSTEDGIAYSWEGLRVFCNPPFSQIARWAAKFARERDRCEFGPLAIIPVSPDTKWWRAYVRHKAVDVPLSPRTRFIHPSVECEPGCSRTKAEGGKGHRLGLPADSPPAGISVVEYRPDWLLP